MAAILALAAAGVAHAPADTAQINPAGTDQVIRGFGGATVFYPTTPLAASDLDSLFENGPGQIGLTLMRIRVASDDAWRAVELSNAQGAIARNANVMSTQVRLNSDRTSAD